MDNEDSPGRDAASLACSRKCNTEDETAPPPALNCLSRSNLPPLGGGRIPDGDNSRAFLVTLHVPQSRPPGQALLPPVPVSVPEDGGEDEAQVSLREAVWGKVPEEKGLMSYQSGETKRCGVTPGFHASCFCVGKQFCP